MNDLEGRLAALGIVLPDVNPPVGSYVSYMWCGDLLSVSGQTAKRDGVLQFKGEVGRDLSLDDGCAAARLCVLNLLLQVRLALGGRNDQAIRCLKLSIYVRTEDGDALLSAANAALNLMRELFPSSPGVTCSMVGASALPGGSAVEIDGLFEI